jgi:hypothetical protein
MIWKRNRAQARQAMEEATQTATDLADKSLVIGWGGVAFLVGVAAVGAVVTYAAARTRKKRKAAKDGGPS